MKHLIFFDSTCPICIRSVQHLLNIDCHFLFLFSPLNGQTASKLLTGNLQRWQKANTLVLLENYAQPSQKVWAYGRGVFRIFWLLGGKWRLLGWLAFVPFGIDLAYQLFARSRHRLSVKANTDLLVQHPQRFLP